MFTEMSFYESVFSFALSESNSSFDIVLKKLIVYSNMLNSTNNIFDKAYVLDNDTITIVTISTLPMPAPKHMSSSLLTSDPPSLPNEQILRK